MNGKGTLLLVDDDPAILLTVGDKLQHAGYEVVRAASAEQALVRLETITPQVVVLDISMPGAGGLSFIKSISGHDGKLLYPVLVFTARAELDEFFEKTSVDGFISKTCEPAELIREVERVIAARKKADTAAKPRSAKWKILIAEDDPSISAALGRSMSGGGHEVAVVASGYEVLEQAVMMKPDVILLKCVLPNLSGQAAAGVLAGMPNAKTIPVILYDETGVYKPDTRHPNVRRFVASNAAGDLRKAVEGLLAQT